MHISARREAVVTRVTKFLPLVWAWLWRRPSRTLLAVLATACAFTLYGLALGAVAGIQRMAAIQHVETGPGLALGAAALCAIGFGLILFLTANAMAQAVRLRMVEFGVLKALGFSHRLIILLVAAEAILPCLAGAALGLAVAQPLLPRVIAALPFPPGFPAMSYSPAILAGAVVLAVLLGGASAALPVLRIIRLDVAAALAGGLGSGAAPTRTMAAPTTERTTAAAVTGAGQIWRQIPKTDPHLLCQVVVMTRIGLGTLRHRIKGALAVVTALGLITVVMNPLLILIDSFKAMMALQGSPVRVMVTQPEVHMWRDSLIPIAWTDIIKQAPGIARAADGTPLAEARAYLEGCEHPERKAGDRGICVQLYGLEKPGLFLPPKGALVAGRTYRPGTHEIIMAGNAAAQEGARPGTRFRIGKQEWLVTGISESKSFWVQGTAYGVAAQVRAATAHPDHAAFVVAQLNSPADLETFRAALRAHPEMKLDVAREDDFYNGPASRQTRGWIIVVYIVGSLISVGAGAGIFHLMQVTVEARAMEMAVLRAIGFSASAVAASVVLEAMLLAAGGALLGMLILWLWLDGTIYRSGLPVAVAWGRLLLAIGWSLGVALVGALSPALAAVRPEVAEALRK